MAPGTLEEATRMLENLKLSINVKTSKSLDICERIVRDLKLKLTHLPSLPPQFRKSDSAQQELLLAREVLEHAVLISVQRGDEVSFERNFMQLKPYYTDARSSIPLSTKESHIVGLNLLRLLVQNRIAEFHTEIELFPAEIQDDENIRIVIQLEQALMEGAYHKVFSVRQGITDSSYSYFMDLLSTTVKQEIATCIEKSYESLSTSAAKKLLGFTSDGDLLECATERGWEVAFDTVTFSSVVKGPPREEIPALSLIQRTLGYARELERIV